jgi:hypothetical protein
MRKYPDAHERLSPGNQLIRTALDMCADRADIARGPFMHAAEQSPEIIREALDYYYHSQAEHVRDEKAEAEADDTVIVFYLSAPSEAEAGAVTAKLWAEHEAEAERRGAEFWNEGNVQGERSVGSKTGQGYLTSEIDPATMNVTHHWELYRT